MNDAEAGFVLADGASLITRKTNMCAAILSREGRNSIPVDVTQMGSVGLAQRSTCIQRGHVADASGAGTGFSVRTTSGG